MSSRLRILMLLPFASACGLYLSEPDNAKAVDPSLEEPPAVVPSPTNSNVVAATGMTKVALTGCTSTLGPLYYATVKVGGNPYSLFISSSNGDLTLSSSLAASPNVVHSYPPTAGLATQQNYRYTFNSNSYYDTQVHQDTLAWPSTPSATTPTADLNFNLGFNFNNVFFRAPTCTKVGPQPVNDGTFGIGVDASISPMLQSPIGQLKAKGLAANDTIALQTCDVGGNMWLGGYDPAALTQLPTWAAAANITGFERYYAVSGIDVLVNGNSVLSPNNATFDTTTISTKSLGLWLSQSASNALADSLRANPNFVANFNTNLFFVSAAQPSKLGHTREQLDVELPKVTLILNQNSTTPVSLSVPATYSYLMPQVDDSGVVTYRGALYYSTTNNIVGLTFLRKHIAIFDRAGKRIGFAPHTGCPNDIAYQP